MTNHLHLLVVTLVLTGASLAARADAIPCNGGWDAIRATILRMVPPDAKVTVRGADGMRRLAGARERLCAGDTLEKTDGLELELLEAGRVVKISTQPYRLADAQPVGAAVKRYIDGVLQAVGQLRPPVPPARPTGGRGGADGQESYQRLQAPNALRGLPRQRITADSILMAVWREGQAPYRCNATDEDTQTRWQSEPTLQGWCVVGVPAAGLARLSVRDDRGASMGWNLQPATWAELPRPAWLAASDPMPAERLAWAAWLWREAAPEWRLQAIAMLQSLATREPIAAELLDRIVEEGLPAGR